MRIAVVENEAEERKQIGSYIVEYFQEKAILADLQYYKDGQEIVEAAKASMGNKYVHSYFCFSVVWVVTLWLTQSPLYC